MDTKMPDNVEENLKDAVIALKLVSFSRICVCVW